MILIPLRSSERVYSPAKVTAGLIAANVAIFLYQVSLSPRALNDFVTQWGIVPDRLNVASLVTSMFLHGGWLHILGNMLFLWVFGRNVEDLIGGTRYLALYLVCGVAAGIVQVIANPSSPLPTIGASGAIAGIMGAYLIRFPRTHIKTLFFFFFVTTLEIPGCVSPAVLVRHSIFQRVRLAGRDRLHRRRRGLVRARRRIHRRDAADPPVPGPAKMADLVFGRVAPRLPRPGRCLRSLNAG